MKRPSRVWKILSKTDPRRPSANLKASQRLKRMNQIIWDKAVERCKAAAKTLKGASTTKPEDLFSVWGNKGQVLRRYFRYEEARQYFKKATLGQLVLMDITDTRAQDVLQDLATSYLDFEGELLGDVPEILDDSYAMLQKIRAQREKAMAEESPLTLITTAHIARVESCRHNHDETEQLFHKIIPIAERTLGPCHFDSLAARAYFAQGLVRHERYDDAEQELAKILPKFKFNRPARKDGNHPDHIVALWCLIRCYEGHGNLKDAFDRVKELEEVLEVIGGQGLGKKHPFARTVEEIRLQLEARVAIRDQKENTTSDLKQTHFC